MIEPIPFSDKVKGEFIVADIENEKDGKLICIGTSYRWNGKITHEVHANWCEWFIRLLELSKTNAKFRTVYAHNGGGWDWLSLLEFLLKDERFRYWKIEGCRVQSKIVILRVLVKRNDYGKKNKKPTRFTLRFADSLYLLRSSLEKLSGTLLGTGKIKLDEMPWETYRKNPKLFYQYLERDCEALLLCLEKTLTILREKIAKIDCLGLTIASTALKVWRTGFLDRKVTIPYEQKVKQFLRDGYRGGRVEVFSYGVFQTVKVYDINSLYPYAMRSTLVPTSDKGQWTDIFRWKLPGVYQVQFEQRNTDILPLLVLDGTGAYNGVGTFYMPELKALMEFDPSAKLKLIRGYCFLEQDYLFSSYVDTLYALRQTDRNGPIDLIAKYLLNSLYGKLAQRGEREQYLSFSSAQEFADELQKARHENPPRKIIELSDDLSTAVETVESDVAFEHVGIAGTITSASRVQLYRGLMTAGKDKVVYCDTDSVHTTGDLPVTLVGSELGAFKLEFSGAGVYAGRKLYGLRSDSGMEKIRAKGVSVGNRNGAVLDFASLCRIVKGEKIACRFFQPTTANEVMRGKQACVFRERKRTLQMVKK